MRAETNPGAVQNCFFRLANTRRPFCSLAVHIGSEIIRFFRKQLWLGIQQSPCRTL